MNRNEWQLAAKLGRVMLWSPAFATIYRMAAQRFSRMSSAHRTRSRPRGSVDSGFRNEASITTVLAAEPEVFNHNLKRSGGCNPIDHADYNRSLQVLRAARRRPTMPVKSGLMLGLGETDDELRQALCDLREHGCTTLTLGQYLAPSRQHFPVARYVHPDEFEAYRQLALQLGFVGVAAGPLVRSSYHAERLAGDIGGG